MMGSSLPWPRALLETVRMDIFLEITCEMSQVISFEIDQLSCIEILIPNVKEKFNYYYKPTEPLHMFDKVTVFFKTKNKKFVIFEDHMNEIIITLKSSLENVIANKSKLPLDIKVGQLGYHYNIDTENERDGVAYECFWVWSAKGIQTWMYNKNKKIYLEVSPSYLWFFTNPEQGEEYVSFEKFLKNYEPLVVQEISVDTVRKWLDQCEKVINTMIKV